MHGIVLKMIAFTNNKIYNKVTESHHVTKLQENLH